MLLPPFLSLPSPATAAPFRGCPKALPWLLITIGSLAACQPGESFETRIDLAKSLATAEVHHETGVLDLGAPEARDFLGTGWSWNERSGETTFVWGTGKISELRFFLSTARDLDLEIRCFPFSYPGAPTQVIRPTLNDTTLDSITLAQKTDSYRIHIPASALVHGMNRLLFEYAYSRTSETSDGGDKRSLAVGWDWIRFHLDPPPAEPAITATETGISMPFGTGIDFHFMASGRDRLVIDQIEGPDLTDSGIEITLLADGSSEIELLDLRSSQRNLAIDLPTGAQRAVRLSMRAASRDGGPDPILLRGARIETALSGSETFVDVPDSDARQLEPNRPNVLVYVVDTMRADHLGLYGYSRNVSPEIDEFGSQAYVFDQAMAQTSWTKPAVASIFTGLGTTAHGVNHREHRLPSRLLTMAELFSDASYSTVAFTTNAYFSTDSGLRQGFDEFTLQPARADRVHQQIFEWLDREDREDPFLLYVHTIDPHAPYDPPESFRREFAAEVEDPDAGSFEHIRGLAFGEIPRTPQTDQSLIRLYDAEIAYADRQFGLLLDDLRRRGLYDEMLILFVSDHGEGFYEHGIQGHGWDLYRESTQVPMILKLPGDDAGRRVRELAQQIDLLPTLLDLTSIEIPEVVQGRSLASLLASEARSEADPIPVFSYLDYEGRKGMSVIYGQWKLIEPLSSSFAPSRELYDRLEDPDEQIDLSAQYPILAGYLASLVRQQLLELEQLPEVESMEFDDQTRQQLKALGYFE